VTSYLKAHLSDAHSVSVDFDGIRTSHKSSEFMPGIGLAVRHQLASPLWIKGSYERTLRLPDAYEQFGDGLLLLPNPQLKPERSHNANLGIVAEFSHTDHEWWFETQTFVRQVTDLIRVEAVGLTAQYVNQRNVRSAGIDAALRYTWRRMWSFETSATFQDLRNMSRFEDGRPSYVYLDRIPNSPFFISSQQIRFSTSWMEAAWTGYYVEAYYLKWPSLGAADGKHVIPTQFTQSLRVQLGRSDRPHSLTLECLNLTSARVYDQFRLQKPGRSFHLTYRLHYK
jgi:outer membrane receptor protein involved in Fe transport